MPDDKSTPCLRVMTPHGKERCVTLVKQFTTIGRDAKNDVAIQDRQSSREHCRVEKNEDGGFVLVDLGSANGVKVNGEKVTNRVLKPGDEIMIGETRMTFLMSAEGAMAATELPPGAEPAAAARQTEVSKREGPKFVLEIMEGPDAGKVCELGDKPVMLGRAQTCDVVIASEKASNSHAQVAREGDNWVLRDLASTNGTNLNGATISAPQVLAPGAKIDIGRVVLVFRQAGAAAAAPPPEKAAAAAAVAPAPAAPAFAGTGGRLVMSGKKKLALAAGALVAAAVLAGALIAAFSGPGKGGKKLPVPEDDTQAVPAEASKNLLANPSFSEFGADNLPARWEIDIPGKRGVAASVSADIDRDPAAADKAALAVRLRGAEPDARCRVTQTVPIDLKKWKGYRVEGWVRGEKVRFGQYGLSIAWLDAQGAEIGTDGLWLFQNQKAWTKLEKRFAPPPDAVSLRVACEGIGADAAVFFDDVAVFAEQSAPAADAPPVSGADGLRCRLDHRGLFSIDRAGAELLRGGRLVAEGPLTTSDMALAGTDYPPAREGDEVRAGGRFAEFGARARMDYDGRASPAADGVDLAYAVYTEQTFTLKSLSIQFDVVGAAAANSPEIFRENGSRETLEPGSAADAAEVRFSGPDTEVTVTLPSKASGVSWERRGNGLRVTVVADRGVRMGEQPIDVKLAFSAQGRYRAVTIEGRKKEIAEAVRRDDWPAQMAALDRLIQEFGSKFPKEKEDAERSRKELVQKMEALVAECAAKVAAAAGAAPADAARLLDAARSGAAEAEPRVLGTEFAGRIADLRDRVGRMDAVRREAESERRFQEAKLQFDNKRYADAREKFNDILASAELRNTPAAERIRGEDWLAKIDQAEAAPSAAGSAGEIGLRADGWLRRADEPPRARAAAVPVTAFSASQPAVRRPKPGQAVRAPMFRVADAGRFDVGGVFEIGTRRTLRGYEDAWIKMPSQGRFTFALYSPPMAKVLALPGNNYAIDPAPADGKSAVTDGVPPSCVCGNRGLEKWRNPELFPRGPLEDGVVYAARTTPAGVKLLVHALKEPKPREYGPIMDEKGARMERALAITTTANGDILVVGLMRGALYLAHVEDPFIDELMDLRTSVVDQHFAEGLKKPLRSRAISLLAIAPHLDRPYDAMTAGTDGKVYFATMPHHPSLGADLFSYDPRSDGVRNLGDIDELSHAKGPDDIPSMVHAEPTEIDGWMFFAGQDPFYGKAGAFPELPRTARYPGTHAIAFNMSTGTFRDFGVVDKGKSMFRIAADRKRGMLYFRQEYTGGPVHGLNVRTGQFIRNLVNCPANRFVVGSDGRLYYGKRLGRRGPCDLVAFDPQSRAETVVAKDIGPSINWIKGQDGMTEILAQVGGDIGDGKDIFRLNIAAQKMEKIAEFSGQIGWGDAALHNGILYKASIEGGGNGTNRACHLLALDIATGKTRDYGIVVDQRGRVLQDGTALEVALDGTICLAGQVWPRAGDYYSVRLREELLNDSCFIVIRNLGSAGEVATPRAPAEREDEPDVGRMRLKG
jgi:pSer/pThr/pTyr-binding forkhead associated (FHA) protein